jgi:hypothetical protein
MEENIEIFNFLFWNFSKVYNLSDALKKKKPKVLPLSISSLTFIRFFWGGMVAVFLVGSGRVG